MILSLMIPLILTVWLYRIAIRGSLERVVPTADDDSRPAVVPTPTVLPNDDSTAPDAERPSWTALDEIQLNRLLKSQRFDRRTSGQ